MTKLSKDLISSQGSNGTEEHLTTLKSINLSVFNLSPMVSMKIIIYISNFVKIYRVMMGWVELKVKFMRLTQVFLL